MPDKESCPTECCSGIDFKRKDCERGYECNNGICEEIDTDHDGLTDLKEEDVGTNPRIVDTDGDTLNDYQEVSNLKTNPLARNTDDDRYDDAEDDEPTSVNSARLTIRAEETEASVDDIVELIDNFKSFDYWFDKLSTMDTRTEVVTITNNGDDYTKGFSFDIVTYVVFTEKEMKNFKCEEIRSHKPVKAKTQHFSFTDTIEPSQSLSKTLDIEVLMVVPETITPQNCVGKIVCPCGKKVTQAFDNLSYERFP